MIGSQGFRKSTIIAVGAMFAALVAAVTFVFVIPIGIGYFNLGEIIIYVAALLFGPLVGAIAGAGASIADIISPYSIFAPGTFIIKGAEGFIVGYLNLKIKQKTGNFTLSAIISIITGGFVMIAGYFLYETFILGNLGQALIDFPVNIVQMVVGLIIAVPVMYAIQRVFPQLRNISAEGK